jgi:sporulation protein YlmC with PRC-barrel domain
MISTDQAHVWSPNYERWEVAKFRAKGGSYFMAHHADESGLGRVPVLVKMSDSGFGVKSREADIRRLGVFNQDGDQIGSVEDFYVDTHEREVRFLEVSSGGFLGLGEKRFLVPVEAVTNFREGGVTVGESREKTSGSPFDTKIVPLVAYERDEYYP